MLCQIGPLSGDNGDMAISYYMFRKPGLRTGAGCPRQSGFRVNELPLQVLDFVKAQCRRKIEMTPGPQSRNDTLGGGENQSRALSLQ
jgi:hypothetical protein